MDIHMIDSIVKWKSLSRVRLFVTHGLYSPWDSPGQNTGVGSLSLLQGIFPTQGSNPGLPHCRRILSQLRHQGSPGILEWVAFPFSRWSSQPKDWTRVSCPAGGFFTNWAIRDRLNKRTIVTMNGIHIWLSTCWWNFWNPSTWVLFLALP